MLPGVASLRVLATVMAHACGGGAASPPDADPPPAVTGSDAAIRHELLRIEQQFHPNDEYRIVVDAWLTSEPTPSLVRVTMGWLDTGSGDARSPFGKGVRRHVDVLYERRDASIWVIALVADDKRRELEVVLGPDGIARIFAEITTDVGVTRCEPRGGKLLARRLVGLPIGLDRLEVECLVDHGEVVRGPVLTR